MADDPGGTIQALIDTWCDRREYHAIAIVLPAWASNNGLTDGWETLHDALKHAYAMCTNLPPVERDTLKKTYVDIDYALRNR